ADLFLAGHLHISHTGHTQRYKIQGHSALVVQAGTATSTRERGEANSFNVIHIAFPEMAVERFVWDRSRTSFVAVGIERFKQVGEGWIRTGEAGEVSVGNEERHSQAARGYFRHSRTGASAGP